MNTAPEQSSWMPMHVQDPCPWCSRSFCKHPYCVCAACERTMVFTWHSFGPGVKIVWRGRCGFCDQHLRTKEDWWKNRQNQRVVAVGEYNYCLSHWVQLHDQMCGCELWKNAKLVCVSEALLRTPEV